MFLPASSVPSFGRSKGGATILAVTVAASLLATTALVAAPGSYEQIPLERRREMQREVRVIIGLLENHHYTSRTFVEMEPGEILLSYMRRLDPLHLVFLASDEKYLQRRFGRTMKSSYLLSGDLYPAFEVHDLFMERWNARKAWIQVRLGRGFDLGGDGSFDESRRSASFPSGASDADLQWERLLSAWLIGERLVGRTPADALGAVRRRVERLDRALGRTDIEAIEETFLNALLELRDPHSGYHSWDSMLDLEVDLAGSFVGVGVEIKRMDGETLISHLTPGGAAESTGGIRPGDRLIAIGDVDGAPTPVEGVQLRDIVKILRGRPGTSVRLAVSGVGESDAREVVIERRRITVESDRARAFVVDMDAANSGPARNRVGVIRLPSFYGEPWVDGVEGTSCAADVAELLTKLKDKGICAIVLDLRDNPGGRTDEAVRIAGHFIDTGPVMLLASGEGGIGARPRVESDEVPGMLWDGPLVVLTSSTSASASELVAGALQAYGRALVVGAVRTFGKGTSQSVIPLSDAAKRLGVAEGPHFGLVRITGQKFFLPDGNSTQMRGVAADIVVASASGELERTESAMPGALAWTALDVPGFADQREAAVPAALQLSPDRRSRLLAASAARMASLPEFAWHERRLAYRASREAVAPLSLNLERRRESRDAHESERRALTDERRRLAAELDFPWSSVLLDEVEKQSRAHDQGIAERADETPSVYSAGIFAHRDSRGGRWQEVRIDTLHTGLIVDELESLAEAFSTVGGELSPEALRVACTAMDDEEFDRVGAFERSLAGVAGLDRDAPRFRSALAAMFARLVEFNPWLVGDPVPLDIALREGLRVAESWGCD